MSANYFNELYASNRQYYGDHPENMLRDYFTMCDKKGRVLDIGIGQGRNARFFMKQGYGVDGIDISQVAIDGLTRHTKDEQLDLKLFQMDFSAFSCVPKTYSAILIIDLFHFLSELQINNLANKASKWLKRKGIIFITANTANDDGFVPPSPNWQKVSENSYIDNAGNYRTYTDIDEVISKFRFFRPIYKWEGYGEMHSHGTETIEQHHMFELILQKL